MTTNFEAQITYLAVSIHARVSNIMAMLNKGKPTLEGLEAIDEQTRVMRQDVRGLTQAVKDAIQAELKKGR